MSNSAQSLPSPIPNDSKKSVLITGAAGFIGFHVSERFLSEGHRVVGLDNFNSYYDVALKRDRAAHLSKHPNFKMAECGLEDRDAVAAVWQDCAPDIVIHLAAQAGVRYSIENPDSYVSSNIIGTFNILEVCRRFGTKHLLAASTSSIYGSNTSMPFKEGDSISRPLSLYAATKGSAELLGHTYSALFGIPTTFFRFFTVYGPWGRPDMAAFKFTRAILADESIDVYNHGDLARDFTYIDDLVEAIIRLTENIPQTNEPSEKPQGANDFDAPFRVVNIGKGAPDKLMDFISELEKDLGKVAEKNFMPMQDGEMLTTFADTEMLESLIGYRPNTPLSVGIPKFASWYREYYKV